MVDLIFSASVLTELSSEEFSFLGERSSQLKRIETLSLPADFHEKFKALWTSCWNWKMQAVTSNTPNNGRRVNILQGIKNKVIKT